MQEFLSFIVNWSERNTFSIVATVFIVVCYFAITRSVIPKIKGFIRGSGFNDQSIVKVNRWVKVLCGAVGLVLLLLSWGFDFQMLVIFSTSIIALAGVALFANWSVLSNVTAFFVLLLHKSFRQGNYIRVLEMDNYIEGLIVEVNLFGTSLQTLDNEIVIYPNNLLVSRPVIVSPKRRLKAFGKTSDFNPNASDDP